MVNMKYLLLMFLMGCVTREQVQADIYLNSGIPADLCAKYPELKRFGMYRIVTCSSKPDSTACQHGEKTFRQTRPYCAGSTPEYLSMWQQDVEKYLGELNKPK